MSNTGLTQLHLFPHVTELKLSTLTGGEKKKVLYFKTAQPSNNHVRDKKPESVLGNKPHNSTLEKLFHHCGLPFMLGVPTLHAFYWKTYEEHFL